MITPATRIFVGILLFSLQTLCFAGNPAILLVDMMQRWDGQDYIFFKELAKQSNIDLQLHIDDRNPPEITGEHFVGLIIFGGGGGDNNRGYGGITSGLLNEIHQFVEKGGRVAFFSLPRLAQFNELLEKQFKLTIAEEFLTTRKHSLLVDGGVFLRIWEGLEVGSKTASYDKHISVCTKYAKLDDKQIETFLPVENSRIHRKTSLYGKIGHGEYVFTSSFCTGGGGIRIRNAANIFRDKNIDSWDNSKAARLLVEWLAKRRNYD